jgi:uncharacterized protein
VQLIKSSWRRRAWTLVIAAGMAWAVTGIAQSLKPVPPLAARVTDLTNTLSAEQKSTLESQLAAFEQRKGSQVVVLIVDTTQPEPIEDYSIRVAEAWKIGRGKVDGKKVDDGVILLVAKADRKIRIEVGYGLEGSIHDAIASRIIAESISPKFRQGDFFGGVQAAVGDITRLIDGEALPPAWQHGQRGAGQRAAAGGGGNLLGLGLAVLVGGVIATMVLGRVLGSAAGGVGAGVIATMSGLSIVLAAVLGVGAFIFLLVFAASGGLSQVGQRTYRSGPVFFPGGFGGGGGGGGGFGGGGGGFGGGGASGSW